MPRYEFVKAGTPDRPGINPFTKQPIVIKGIPKEHRFWEVEADGSVLRFAAGRVGQRLLRWSRDYGSPERAQEASEAATTARTESGYALVGEAVVLRQKDGLAGSPLGPLESRIEAAPDDDQLLAQCAVALREAGTTLGELPTGITKWVSEGDERTLEVEWHHGFVRSARLAYRAWDSGGALSLVDVLTELLGHPVGRFVQRLTVGLNNTHGQCEYEEVMAIIGAAQPPALRTLFVGDFQFPDETELSWARVGDCDPLWTLPSLRELTLQGGGIRLGVVDAPRLERLELRTGGLGKRTIQSLQEARIPHLCALKVWFGDSNYGGECQASDVEPLLQAGRFPALRELGLMNAEFTDDLCAPLLESAILPKLSVLDLSLGTLTDDGAAILGRGIASLRHLQRLNVDANLLTDKGIARLAALGAALEVGEQRESGPEDRYVAFGE